MTSSRQQTKLLASDSSQSTIAELTGGKSTSFAYSVYGDQSAQQDTETRLGFNGQLREARIGWYLLGNGYRAYNPRLMRFHSPDSWSPFGRGGLNAYMYCVGDPVNYSDPTGHSLFSALKLLAQENISFGGSAAELAAKNATRRANGIARQQAMYRLAEAGGTPTLVSRPSTSSGLTEMFGYVAGAPGPRGNRSPAIQYVETRPKNHPGYVAGAARDGLSHRPSRPSSQASGPTSGSRNASRSTTSNSYEPPPTYGEAMSLWNADTFAASQQPRSYTVNRMAVHREHNLGAAAPFQAPAGAPAPAPALMVEQAQNLQGLAELNAMQRDMLEIRANVANRPCRIL